MTYVYQENPRSRSVADGRAGWSGWEWKNPRSSRPDPESSFVSLSVSAGSTRNRMSRSSVSTFRVGRNSSILRGVASGPRRYPHPSSGYVSLPWRFIASTTAFVIWTPPSVCATLTVSFEASTFIIALRASAVSRTLREDVQHFLEARREAVHFLGRVIYVEGCAGGRRDVQPLHQRLRAVVAGPDRDPLHVQDRRDIVRVDVAEGERDHAAAAGGILQAEPVESLHAGERVQRILREFDLVPADVVHPDLVQVVHGDPEADRPRHVRRAALELEGDIVPLRSAEVDLADHLSPAHQWLHLLEPLLLPVQHPDPRGTEHLVAAEREEVRVHLLDVHGHVVDALGAVHDANRTDLVGPLRDLLDRVDRPEDVRCVRDRDDLRPLRDQGVVVLHPQGAVVAHPDPLQLHALRILDE